MIVAIQGELGSFSHEAALALVPNARLVPCATAQEVLQSLDTCQSDAAVIPVENSLAGSVIDFYDLFFGHEFSIQQELELRIRHNLIAAPGATADALHEVFSHPVALAQCRDFFAAHPHLQPVPFYDTAGAVRHILRENRPDFAAIASRQAATQYNGLILEQGIEDRAQSYTRFWLIRRSGSAPVEPSPSKLSLVFALENRPGALLRALQAFSARRLNLTKIESRPIASRPWEYMFYTDVTIPGHADADAVVEDLRTICPIVKELGRYSVLPPASN